MVLAAMQLVWMCVAVCVLMQLSSTDARSASKGHLERALRTSQKGNHNDTVNIGSKDTLSTYVATCIFPFSFGGVEYNDCAPGTGQPNPWCATSLKSDGKNMDTWKICSSVDILSTYEATCIFPFSFGGVEYNECAPGTGQPNPWCATSLKPDGKNIETWKICSYGDINSWLLNDEEDYIIEELIENLMDNKESQEQSAEVFATLQGSYKKGNSPKKAQFFFNGDDNDNNYDYTYGDYRYNYDDDEDYITLDHGVDIGSGVIPFKPEDTGEGIVPEVTEIVQYVPIPTANYSPKTEKPGFSWHRFWNNVGDTVSNSGVEVGVHLSNMGDKVEDKYDDFSETLADAAEDIKDKFETFNIAQEKFLEAENALVETANRAGELLNQTYQEAKDGLPTLRDQDWDSLKHFSILVNAGGKYVHSKITNIADKVHSSTIIQKLQEKLDHGDEQVAEFLHLIGYKQTELEQKQDRHNVKILPDVFQDDEVQDQLQNLVDAGTLTQDHFYIITQQQIQKEHTISTAIPFTGRADAEVLRQAMSGWGTDEEAIINVLAYRTSYQRQIISESYNQAFKRNLADDLKNEIDRDFEDVMLALITPMPLYLAQALHKALQEKHINTLIEILCTQDKSSIENIKKSYLDEYGKELTADLGTLPSIKNREFFIVMITQDMTHDLQAAVRNISQVSGSLTWNEDNRCGTSSQCNPFGDYPCCSPYRWCGNTDGHCTCNDCIDYQVRQIRQFLTKSSNPMLRMISSFPDGLVKNIYESITLPAVFFAKELNSAIIGTGTNEPKLIRIIVTRREVDMENIKEKYETFYENSLENAIEGDTSGTTEDALLALIES